MSKTSVLAAAAFAFVAGLALSGSASAQSTDPGKGAKRATTAPTRAQPPRARTRIRVTPLYPYRTFPTDYPPPYDIEWPGPGAVRQCGSWLAPEYRPSGTVIVPHMRCWWQRG
jgi:hypothetical protein